ncbi:hypothetical protein GQ53DRAFT_53497 [Thozetella sp. PMI_491]|nr:hypothetical protein GQ53DRAFT_53497 [Thozetella sp. PMI_491]
MTIYALATGLHRIAYLYVGQAIRIGQSFEQRTYEGLESRRQIHAQKLWCTIVALDQRCSAAVGIPHNPSCHDDEQDMFGLRSNPKGLLDVPIRLNISIINSLNRVVTVLSKHLTREGISNALASEISNELAILETLGHDISIQRQLCHQQALSTIARPPATSHLFYCHVRYHGVSILLRVSKLNHHQCVLLATKPFLLDLVRGAHLARGGDPASPSSCPEYIARMARTCVNAAVLILNIMSVLHKQYLLETFVFFDLEVTFLSAVVLVFADLLAAKDSGYLAFVHSAKAILGQMSTKGNLLASSLGSLLENVSGVACALPRSSGRSWHALQGGPVTMIQDGQVLNHAILDVIEPQQRLETARRRSNLDRGPALSEDSRWRWQPQGLDSSVVAQGTSWAPAVLPGGSIILPPNEIRASGMHNVEGLFTFDIEDLQWLESVQ